MKADEAKAGQDVSVRVHREVQPCISARTGRSD